MSVFLIKNFLTPYTINQPSFDGAIQFHTLPDETAFPYPYTTCSKKTLPAEEGNYTSLYTSKETSSITNTIDKVYPISHNISFTSHLSTGKETDLHDQGRDCTYGFFTRIYRYCTLPTGTKNSKADHQDCKPKDKGTMDIIHQKRIEVHH